MGLFDRLFGDSSGREIQPVNRKPDIDKLLSSGDVEESINELDTYISELCNFGSNLNALNVPQRNFYLIQAFEREIDNGGFSQYFFSDSGDFAHETVLALQAVGALKMSDLLQRSFEPFPSAAVPVGQGQRQQFLEKTEDVSDEFWGRLELEFYEHEPELIALLWQYVKENKSLL
jgi:hypothetical protein